MTYQEFKEKIRTEILDYLPEPYNQWEVKIEEIQKVNGLQDGLFLVSPNNDPIKCMPIFHLQPFYTKLETGEPFELIEVQLASHMLEGLEDRFSAVEMFESLTPEKIMPRLIPVKGNEAIIEKSPHKCLDDLALIYQYDIGNATVRIDTSLAEEKNLSLSEIHAHAKQNIEKCTVVARMDQVLKTFLNTDSEMDFDLESLETPMYILTTQSKQYGAAAVISDTVMEQIRDQMGDYYILPSSQHEVILIPSNTGLAVGDLNQMIQEVNAGFLDPNDYLSDHTYKFNRLTKQIETANPPAVERQHKPELPKKRPRR